MRFQTICQVGPQSCEGMTGAGDLLPRRPTYLATKSMLDVDRRRQLLLEGCLGVLEMWFLAFNKVSNSREQGINGSIFI